MTLGIQPVFFLFICILLTFSPGLDISVSARYKGFLATTIIIIIIVPLQQTMQFFRFGRRKGGLVRA